MNIAGIMTEDLDAQEEALKAQLAKSEADAHAQRGALAVVAHFRAVSASRLQSVLDEAAKQNAPPGTEQAEPGNTEPPKE